MSFLWAIYEHLMNILWASWYYFNLAGSFPSKKYKFWLVFFVYLWVSVREWSTIGGYYNYHSLPHLQISNLVRDMNKHPVASTKNIIQSSIDDHHKWRLYYKHHKWVAMTPLGSQLMTLKWRSKLGRHSLMTLEASFTRIICL